MAFDIFKWRSTGVDHARGEPPPADSVEWSFIPQSAADMMARGRGAKKERVTVRGEGKTEESKKPWLWGIAGAVVGLIVGSWGRGD
jgi:hypothetical protein